MQKAAVVSLEWLSCHDLVCSQMLRADNASFSRFGLLISLFDPDGWVAEWFKAPVLKTGVGASLP
jgi:hypothetical protein